MENFRESRKVSGRRSVRLQAPKPPNHSSTNPNSPASIWKTLIACPYHIVIDWVIKRWIMMVLDCDCEARSSGKVRVFKKVLTDVRRGVYVKNWRISSEDLDIGKGDGWHIDKRRLLGGLSDGVDVVEVNNGRLSFVVVPTRGMGIWKGTFDGCFLGWDSPVRELVHPSYVNLEDRGGLGWLNGFNEWVVRCGLESNGVPGEDLIIDNMGNKKLVRLPLHGRIANIPASEVRAFVGLDHPFELGVKGVVYERSMFGPNLKLSTSITSEVGGNWLKISDVIENVGGIPAETQLLYHCNYGAPFLEDGAHLVTPLRRVAPRDRRASEGIGDFASFGPPQAGFVEQVYFFELLGDGEGRTRVLLTNKDETKATSISFSLRQLPHFTLWKNTASLSDGYVVGLEPATNFPNPRRFERERGRVINLKPRENYAAEVVIAVHLGKEEAQGVKDWIKNLQDAVKPKVFKNPTSEFSPM